MAQAHIGRALATLGPGRHSQLVISTEMSLGKQAA